MPSVSQRQHDYMTAVSEDPKFAKKTGTSRSVAKEFVAADEAKELRHGRELPDSPAYDALLHKRKD